MMRPEIVAIGTSLGGLNALIALLRDLPEQLQAPLVVVQHRGPAPGRRLAELLQAHTRLTVQDAEDKQAIAGGSVYLAPADYHLLIEERGVLALSTDAPVRAARPSIDVLFESAAEAYGPGVVGVLLTGSSADGAEGLAAIKRRGGTAIVQDPASAEAPAMPSAALSATPVDYVLPLGSIAAHLADLLEGTRA
jgi:two-component system chemotaxis response regulator CheB